MNNEFISAIENLGFRLNPANVYQFQFGNQLLNIYKPCGILYENTSLVLEWLNREDEDLGFTKLIKYIKEPNINEVELLVKEATDHHYDLVNKPKEISEKLSSLFGFFAQNHNLHLTNTDLEDIVQEVEKIFYEKNKNLPRETFATINESVISSKNMLNDLKNFALDWNLKQEIEESYLYVSSLCSEPKGYTNPYLKLQESIDLLFGKFEDLEKKVESRKDQPKENDILNSIYDLERKISKRFEFINPFAYQPEDVKNNLKLQNEVSVLRKAISVLLIGIDEHFALHVTKEHKKLLDFGFKKSKDDTYLLEFKKKGVRFYYKSRCHPTGRILYYSKNKKDLLFNTKEHFSAKEVIDFIENIDK